MKNLDLVVVQDGGEERRKWGNQPREEGVEEEGVACYGKTTLRLRLQEEGGGAVLIVGSGYHQPGPIERRTAHDGGRSEEL